MIGDIKKNIINSQINRQVSAHTNYCKKSENKYYNIFSKKMEEIELPDIDLEFNTILIPDKSTVMWTT